MKKLLILSLCLFARCFSAAVKEDWEQRCRVVAQALQQEANLPDAVSGIVMDYNRWPLILSFQRDLPRYYADGFVCSLPQGHLAVISKHRRKRVMDAKTGDVVGKIVNQPPHNPRITDVQMLPDGRFAYALTGGTVAVIEDDGDSVELFLNYRSIESLAVVGDSHESELVVCGNNGFTVYDTKTWKEVIVRAQGEYWDTYGMGFTAAVIGKQVFLNPITGRSSGSSMSGGVHTVDDTTVLHSLRRYDMSSKKVDPLSGYCSVHGTQKISPQQPLAACGTNLAIARVTSTGKYLLDIYDPEQKETVVSHTIKEPILSVVPMEQGVALVTKAGNYGQVTLFDKYGGLLQALPPKNVQKAFPTQDGGLALLTQGAKTVALSVYRRMMVKELIDS